MTLFAVSSGHSCDFELYVDNTGKVQNAELSMGNNGNVYCNVRNESKGTDERAEEKGK